MAEYLTFDSIAFLVLKKWEKYENISVCLYKLQKGIFGTQLV